MSGDLSKPDERVEAAMMLRAHANDLVEESFTTHEGAIDRARDLADKLEAEPEPIPAAVLDRRAMFLAGCGTLSDDEIRQWAFEHAAEVEGPPVEEPLMVAVVSAREQGVIAERERDEAREALRELLDALNTYGDRLPLEQMVALRSGLNGAGERARAVLEGVERTHACVRIGELEEAVELLEHVPGYTGPGEIEGGDARERAQWLMVAFTAAARGERVEPS